MTNYQPNHTFTNDLQTQDERWIGQQFPRHTETYWGLNTSDRNQSYVYTRIYGGKWANVPNRGMAPTQRIALIQGYLVVTSNYGCDYSWHPRGYSNLPRYSARARTNIFEVKSWLSSEGLGQESNGMIALSSTPPTLVAGFLLNCWPTYTPRRWAVNWTPTFRLCVLKCTCLRIYICTYLKPNKMGDIHIIDIPCNVTCAFLQYRCNNRFGMVETHIDGNSLANQGCWHYIAGLHDHILQLTTWEHKKLVIPI